MIEQFLALLLFSGLLLGTDARSAEATVVGAQIIQQIAQTHGGQVAEVLAERIEVHSLPDGGYRVSADGVTVLLPEMAREPLQVAPQARAALHLAFPDGEAKAILTDSGLVEYCYLDDTCLVPIPTAEGAVHILVTIASASSPHTFAFGFEVPSGGHIEDLSSGPLLVLDERGLLSLGLAQPWAVEAGGSPVQVGLEVKDTKAVLFVDHGAGDQYPVVAGIYLGSSMIQGYTWEGRRVLITPTQWARTVHSAIASVSVAGPPGFEELRAKQSDTTRRDWLGQSALNQYLCHAIGAANKSTWNLETDRADKGYWGFIASRCN